MKPVSVLIMALMTTAAVPALACDKNDQAANFPMQAAAFQQKVDGKIAKIRARTEARLKNNGVTAEQAKQVRAHVETVVANIQAATKKVVADGVVTAEEAKTVRQLGRELHKHKRGDGQRS